MSKYRKRLPQLGNAVCLTDGEIENTLSLLHPLDVPQPAAFDMLKHASGSDLLRAYFARYAALARSHGVGLVLESPTMRATRDWGAILGYDAVALAQAQSRAIELLLEIRSTFEAADTPVVLSGTLGPRTDGYNPALRMSAYEAAHYHASSVETFAQTEADMVTARSMTYVEEASGIALLASACSIPAVISFKPGPSGRLLSGDTLSQAIERIDRETQSHPAYYMVECTHGSQLAEILGHGGARLGRVRGVRLTRSHSSLDLSDAQALARHYRTLSSMLPNLSVIGIEYDRFDAMQPVRSHEVAAAGVPYSVEFAIGTSGRRSGPALMRSATHAAEELSARAFS